MYFSRYVLCIEAIYSYATLQSEAKRKKNHSVYGRYYKFTNQLKWIDLIRQQHRLILSILST